MDRTPIERVCYKDRAGRTIVETFEEDEHGKRCCLVEVFEKPAPGRGGDWVLWALFILFVLAVGMPLFL